MRESAYNTHEDGKRQICVRSKYIKYSQDFINTNDVLKVIQSLTALKMGEF